MSWSGTVRCNHCYGEGHNKRTCPKWTETLRRRAQEELDNGGSADGYWGNQYAKRTGTYIDGSCAKALKATRRGSVRRCKYCGTKRHNRRTCSVLKADMALYTEHAIEYRQRIVEDMKERGLGLGALIQTERWGDKYLMLCTQVLWHSISHHMPNNHELFYGRNCANNGHQSTAYPQSDFNERSYHTYTVVGPVTSSAVAASVPEDFLTAEAVADLRTEYFTDRRSACYHDNYYA